MIFLVIGFQPAAIFARSNINEFMENVVLRNSDADLVNCVVLCTLVIVVSKIKMQYTNEKQGSFYLFFLLPELLPFSCSWH